jgi:predicted PurR-regulated permease PerM
MYSLFFRNFNKNTARILIRFVFAFVLIYFLMKIKGVLFPFVLSFFIALFLEKTRNNIIKNFKINKNKASIIVVLLFFFIILSIIVVLLPFYIKKMILIFQKISYDDLLNYRNIFEQKINNIFGERFSPIIKMEITDYIQTNIDIKVYLENTLKSFLAKISSSITFIITPFATYVILKEITETKKAFYKIFLPTQNRQQTISFIHKTCLKIKTFISTQLLIIVILSFLYSIPLLIMGVKNAVLIGILVSFLAFIPYVGFYIGAVISCLITMENHNDINIMFKMLTSLGVVQILDTMFISPRVIGGKVGLNPFWVIFGAIAGMEVFGPSAIILSTPCVIIVDSTIRFLLKNKLL